MLRSSKDLAANAPEYFTPTDLERFDRHPDKLSCSFEFPNGYYLAKAKQKVKFANFPDWVCLLLDRELVERDGTLFCPCNAATGSGVHASPSATALLACFNKVSVPNGWTRGANHHPGAATDLQAEVLVPGPVELSYLVAIVVPSVAAAINEFGRLALLGLSPQTHKWSVAPKFFDRDALSSAIRFGGTINESEWTAVNISAGGNL